MMSERDPQILLYRMENYTIFFGVHVAFSKHLLSVLKQEIHKKVMALRFQDCHTKIRHVDAHATLNEGVVVQVMGELSNNMQPMRRFMQTFVLAPEVRFGADPLSLEVMRVVNG